MQFECKDLKRSGYENSYSLEAGTGGVPGLSHQTETTVVTLFIPTDPQGSRFTREKPIFPWKVGKNPGKGIFPGFYPGKTRYFFHAGVFAK